MKKTLKILIPIICINLLIYVVWGLTSRIKEKETLHIAFIGPLGIESIRDSANAVQMYLDGVNGAGGVSGKKIELRLYDDKDDESIAEELARQIVAEKEVLLVLGHGSRQPSLAAGRVYDLQGVPAITASVTADSVTADNPWYFRTIPNNRMQSEFIANYLRLTLKKSSVSIVYDERADGTSLARSFESAASKLGIEIREKLSFNPENPNIDTQLKWVVEDLMAAEDPGVIFMAVYSTEGARIIAQLKDLGSESSFIGPDSFSDKEFLEFFNDYSKEEAEPGFYSNGIYSTSPFMMSLADERGHAFRKAFSHRFGKEPTWAAACYFDAARVAVEAIGKAGINGKKQIRGSRKRIREALAGFYKIENAVEGISGSITFDQYGDLNRPYVMGVYKNQVLLPAFTQYSQSDESTNVSDIFKRVLNGEYSVLNNELMRVYNVIYANGEILEIANLDVQRGKCTLDFNIWFQYSGRFDAGEIDFSNAVSPIELGEPIFEKSANQITTRVYHVRGDFWTDFDLENYPFQPYIIPIGMRYVSRTDNRMVRIPKLPQVLRLKLPDQDKRRSPLATSPGWRVDDISYYREAVLRRSEINRVNLLPERDGMNISQFNVKIRLKREGWWGAVSPFFPSAIMLGIVYLVFFIPVHRSETRICLAVVVLLANAVFHRNALSHVPMDHSTPVGYVFLSVYGFVLMSIILSLMIWRKHENGEFRTSRRLMTIGKIVYPLAVLSIAVLIGHLYRSPIPFGGL